MTFFAHNLTKLISAHSFCLLIILLGLWLAGLTALPSSACCYDPPDQNDGSKQAEPPASVPPDETAQDSAVTSDVLEQERLLLYSAEPLDKKEQSFVGAGSESFLLIRRYIADGQYLRAKQMAEKRLMTRPFDYQLWGLLETIYSKMGLQNKTRTAAKNAELMHPRRRAPARPAPPMSQQKRYVSRLLQAIGEYGSIE